MTSITAMTIRMCTQFPVRGKLELMFRPKKPSSHRITRITIIVHNMRFLLLNDLLKDLLVGATWSLDRVTVDLTAQQDEKTGSDGDDRQDHAEAANTRRVTRPKVIRKTANEIIPIFLMIYMHVLLSILNEGRVSGPANLVTR
jgi:hypothetical protein